MAIGDYTFPNHTKLKGIWRKRGPCNSSRYTILYCIMLYMLSFLKENIYIYFIHLSHNFLPIEMICLSSNANSYTSVHSVSRQDGAWMPESGKSKLAPKIFQPEEVCFVLPISALQKTSRHESFWTDKNEPKNSETSSVKSFLPIQFLNHLGGIEGLSSKCLMLKDVLSLGFLLE